MQTGVIYARYSCEKQTENSILGQVRECKEFAQRNNIEIINVYKDEAISGRTATKRPAFMQMIKDGENHKFDNVIVWKGDRFSRSRADAAKYKSLLKSKGIRVLSATEANITGPEAILMDGINEAFAEYFSVELAAKVCRGMSQNAIDGKWNGGKITFGYKLSPEKKVEIDEEEAAVVKHIFKTYLTRDITMPELSKELNSHGYRFKDGRRLSTSALSRTLNNEKYLGIYRFHDVVNTTMYPQIIDKETFDAVQEKLKKLRHRNGKGNALLQKYYLTRKLRCGECGEYFSGHSTKYGETRYTHYVCNGRRYKKGCQMELIDKEEIENIVAGAAYDFVMDGIAEEELVNKLLEYGKKEKNPELEIKKKLLEKSKERFRNIQNAIEHGCAYEQFTKRLQELADDIKLQEEELKIAEENVGFATPDMIRNFLKQAREYMYNNDAAKESLISLLVDEVWIYKNNSAFIAFKYRNGKSKDSYSYLKAKLCDSKQTVHQTKYYPQN